MNNILKQVLNPLRNIVENTSSLRVIQTKLVFEVSSLKKKKTDFFIVVGFPLRSTFMVSQLRPRVFRRRRETVSNDLNRKLNI